jgi:cobalt/nickel transport system permease protein
MEANMVFSSAQMHIPDGFLSIAVTLICWIIAIGSVAVALRKTHLTLGERQVPLMGVLAAAIFAGQMLNFSITGGTSGHLLGAAIAAILVGPWPAVLVMTTVVSVQALLFQDGGLLALGANIFNMAVVGVFVSYAVFTVLQRIIGGKKWGIFVSGFTAAWVSIVIASLSCALQLAISGTSPANIAIPAMGGIHALIGIGEGLITVGALAFVSAARPDILSADKGAASSDKILVLGGISLAILLAVLSPLASSHPDGLEWVAEQKGFLDVAQGALYELIPDYVMPGIHNEAIATIVAGILGIFIVFTVAYFVARSERKKA